MGLAEAFHKSGMFSDIKSAAQAIVKIYAGQELGLPPVYAMSNVNIISGKPAVSANALGLLIKRSGKYDYRITEHTDLKCVIDFFQMGQKVGASTWTMDDTKRAGLSEKQTWKQYPRALLFSRALSQGARLYCPDAIGGVYTDEELRNIPQKADQATGEIIEPPKQPEAAKQAVSAPTEHDNSDLWARPEEQPTSKPPVNPALASLWAAIANITVEIKAEKAIAKFLGGYAVEVKEWNPGVVPEGLTVALATTVKKNVQRQQEVINSKKAPAS